MFIGFAKVFFMLSGIVQRMLLDAPGRRRPTSATSRSSTTSSHIVNNTVVQGTIQGVSKLTAEDDARAGAVQRAGVGCRRGAGAADRAGAGRGRAVHRGARTQTPRLTPYFRIAALIPLLYSVYAVFIGSANGLRRFRTQASFDVGFSTAKTILLLGCAFLWSVTRRVRRLRRRGGLSSWSSPRA